MSVEDRRTALSRAIAAAGSAEGWDATLPAVRSLLGRMDADAEPEERLRQAEGLERVLFAESQSFLREPVARELFGVIVAFRRRE